MFLLQQVREFARTLAMANQHDASAMIVVLQVVVPRIDDVQPVEWREAMPSNRPYPMRVVRVRA
jgi:hypothetical protein